MKTVIKFMVLISLLLGGIRGAAQSTPHIQDAKRGNNFGIGYDSYRNNILWGRTSISFIPFQKNRTDSRVDFGETNAHISDTLGNLLFYTNGVMIADKTHHIMQGCDTLNPGLYATNQYTDGWGYRAPQGAIILPKPNNPNEYYVFHIRIHGAYVGEGLYYTEVDMSGNSGLGAVTSLRNPIFQGDSMCLRLNVCRHANGRDWWLIAKRYRSDSYLKILIDPQGVHNLGWQVSPTAFSNYSFNYYEGQDAFSPDGSKFATIQGYSFPVGHYLKLFDFDRCTGTFSNPIFHHFVDTIYSAGISFSPNSQYLYYSSGQTIYQADVSQIAPFTNVQTVARLDNFLDQYNQRTPFGSMYLANDDRIYISTSYNVTNYLHSITNPNAQGANCAVQQHSVYLNTFNLTPFTHPPFFGLGPIDGSPCDTLGINNIPTYGLSSTSVNLQIFPNPTNGILNIEVNDLPPSGELKVVIYNLLGQPFKIIRITNNKTQIPTYDLSNGIYFLSISDGNGKPSTKRFVVQR